MDIDFGVKAAVRWFLGWIAAAFLLVIFPLVVPCMLGFRKIRSAFTSSKTIRGNVVIVTGASSGIGSFIALEYARYGARLVLVARRENKLREVAEACLEAGAMDAAVCPADLTKESDCRRIVEFTVSRFGRVNVLVNNAAMAESGLFEDYETTGSFRRTMAAKAALVQFFDTLRTEPIGRLIDITIGHIPWWWPMIPSGDAAKAVVDASISRKRHAIVPSWYSSWLPYRAFAPELMEWLPRATLVGKPPSIMVNRALNAILGEELTSKLFRAIAALNF
ncbi:11-beta-hydroxysteroid dehydrogenase 1B [Selaginella moellendorffii]|uniref:11-beta-hydroxysteroid dehydrogenase 1B n=1 Tax=Selaginella moellendorffii TaxID=88036 RepID=UPI000D1C4783|nr:11-beta-hydroxysteroid dehydrogenase 1B [Selaginella moellendorffii]|eukprot:XP_024515045.1 11-beta-hydroxysteroid dehydrogenase 1B [Selaginella moellendorffii]